MSEHQIALLRGINVGRAKRIAMADLRAMMADLGFAHLRTILNSGNVVYASSAATTSEVAAQIEQGLTQRLGVTARVIVLTAAELQTIVAENTLAEMATNPSRLLVAILNDANDRQRLEPLIRMEWGSETIALGARVAYLWCPDGILDSKLPAALGSALGSILVTTRNWATILKIQAIVQQA